MVRGEVGSLETLHDKPFDGIGGTAVHVGHTAEPCQFLVLDDLRGIPSQTHVCVIVGDDKVLRRRTFPVVLSVQRDGGMLAAGGQGDRSRFKIGIRRGVFDKQNPSCCRKGNRGGKACRIAA